MIKYSGDAAFNQAILYQKITVTTVKLFCLELFDKYCDQKLYKLPSVQTWINT